MCKHDTPALNLLDVETHQRLAMRAVYRKRADGSEPKVWIVAAKWRFLKCNKASARWVGAPDCQIPLRRHETVDRWARDVVNGTIPLTCCRGHFTFRFSAEDFPRLLTISYSTCWPSLSVPSPARCEGHPLHRASSNLSRLCPSLDEAAIVISVRQFDGESAEIRRHWICPNVGRELPEAHRSGREHPDRRSALAGPGRVVAVQ